MRKQFTDEQRRELIDSVRARESSVPEAAVRIGVAASTAYGWLSKAAPVGTGARRRPAGSVTAAPIVGPRFARLVRSDEIATPLEVRVGAAEILVRRGFDEELLRALVAALKETAT